MYPRNSVIIITYNQEKLIIRAIESLLCQKQYIYEIIISDDCSSDKTWDVIQDYQKKYPNLIKTFRNSKNLGIFGNIEETWSKPTGDIIWYLAGDDEYCNGLFAEANKLIEKNKIDYINKAITLYFDYKNISPTGNETIVKNNLVEKYNPIGLKIRQLICNRTSGVSRKVYNKFYTVRKDIGLYADGLLDIQTQIFSEKSYYSSFVGSIYYTSIGISSKTDNTSMYLSLIKAQEQLKSDIINISKEDNDWLNYRQRKYLFIISPSIVNYLFYLKYFFKVIQKYYGWYFMKRELKCILKDTSMLFYMVKF